MINMRKIFKNKETKAALLAGMTLLTLPGCGKKNVETDPEPGASISIEEDTTKKKNNIETTVENMIEGKTTGENNGTEENTYVDNGTEYVEYTDSTEGYTEGQTEGKTEGQTEAKTEAKTEGKTETGIKLPSDHRVGNVDTTEHTTQKSTHKTTTIKNKDIKVTTTTAKKTTTAKPTTKKVTTTTKVVTTQPTTQKPTEPPTTQPPAPHYDYTLENITQSAEVFNYFAEQMNHDILNGSSILERRFNGEEIWNDGVKDSKIALLLLNENENFNANVLGEVSRGYTDDDIIKGIEYIYGIWGTESIAGTTTDFNKYIIDKDIGNYINLLQNACKNAVKSGDYSEMDKIIEDFLYTDVYDKQNYSAAACYFTYGAGAHTPESAYCDTCSECKDNGSFYGLTEITENKVKTLIR